MRVAYLINQYPKVSHSFIRREILALELQGIDVLRIALRGWDEELVDDEDKLERQRTRYVLRDGPLPLILATIRLLATRPLLFFRALHLAWRLSRRAERPLLVHLVYLAEASRVVTWFNKEPAEHVHAHFGTNSATVAMLAHVLGGPHWSFTVHGPEEFDKAPLLGLPEKIERAKFVVAVSSYGRSQLYRLVNHTLWSKMHVIHCGLDEAFMTSAVMPSLARRLVCVGRLCEQKGQLLLIEAVRRLAIDGVNSRIGAGGRWRAPRRARAANRRLQAARPRTHHWLGQRRGSPPRAARRPRVGVVELCRRPAGSTHGSHGSRAASHKHIRCRNSGTGYSR